MKILLMSLVLVSLLSSDEIQRVQNIVDDIAKLRVDYETCKKQLNSGSKGGTTFEALAMKNDEKIEKIEMNLRDEKQKNKILLLEIATLSKNKPNSSNLDNKIKKLEKIIKNQEKSIKTKDNLIKNLKKEKSKTKVILKDSLDKSKTDSSKKIICEEKNSFPKLVMKEGFEEIPSALEDTYLFEASAFRVKDDAAIYDNINGNQIAVWEKNTSFTSNERSDEWVKITGYFIDKKWLPSDKELWVKSQDVIQR